ncbi:MAG: phosphatase PAP2 family protein [Alphaproteobacteria bacterium]|nr:phosphatase PAP2 family protein [Alphaproteobacteria bacterium]
MRSGCLSLRQENNYIFIPALILNILVIFSCLPIGQHYFIDILAAFPVFLFAVWSEQLLFSCVHYLHKLKERKQMADFKI